MLQSSGLGLATTLRHVAWTGLRCLTRAPWSSRKAAGRRRSQEAESTPRRRAFASPTARCICSVVRRTLCAVSRISTTSSGRPERSPSPSPKPPSRSYLMPRRPCCRHRQTGCRTHLPACISTRDRAGAPSMSPRSVSSAPRRTAARRLMPSAPASTASLARSYRIPAVRVTSATCPQTPTVDPASPPTAPRVMPARATRPAAAAAAAARVARPSATRSRPARSYLRHSCSLTARQTPSVRRAPLGRVYASNGASPTVTRSACSSCGCGSRVDPGLTSSKDIRAAASRGARP